MCRSCKVIADVHRRPCLGVESFDPSSTNALSYRAGRDAHSAVDEVLDSWSEASCGKAFLALTDLINFENNIKLKENEEKQLDPSNDIQLKENEEKQLDPSTISMANTQIHSFPNSAMSPSLLLTDPPQSSVFLQSENQTSRHSRSRPIESTLSEGFHSSAFQMCQREKNSNALVMPMFEESSLIYMIQSLKNCSNDHSDYHSDYYRSRCNLSQQGQPTATTPTTSHHFDQLSTSLYPCLSTLTSNNDHLFYDENRGIIDECISDDESVDQLLNRLLLRSDASRINTISFTNCLSDDSSIGFSALGSSPCTLSGIATRSQQEPSIPIESSTSLYNRCYQPHGENPSICQNTFMTDIVNKNQSYLWKPRRVKKETSTGMISTYRDPLVYGKQQHHLNTSSTFIPKNKKTIENLDFSIFYCHPLIAYMKEFEARRLALFERACQNISDYQINSKPSTLTDGDLLPLRYCQYFGR